MNIRIPEQTNDGCGISLPKAILILIQSLYLMWDIILSLIFHSTYLNLWIILSTKIDNHLLYPKAMDIFTRILNKPFSKYAYIIQNKWASMLFSIKKEMRNFVHFSFMFVAWNYNFYVANMCLSMFQLECNLYISLQWLKLNKIHRTVCYVIQTLIWCLLYSSNFLSFIFHNWTWERIWSIYGLRLLRRTS